MRRFVMLAACAAVAAFHSPTARAVPEDRFEDAYVVLVQPFYDLIGKGGEISGVDGIPVSYRAFVNPLSADAIVIAPGRTESHLKYAETAFDLFFRGYSVFVLDHRGQGFSGRMAADRHAQYVRRFDDYVADLKTFLEQVVRPTGHERHFLLGNSMGGGVAALYLERHPGDFDAAALSAPMLEIDTTPYSEPVALAIASFASTVGLGRRFAPGQGGYSPDARFTDNQSTRSEVRWRKWREQIRRHPALEMGGVSYRWVQQTLLALRRLQKGAARVRTPVLLLQAGDERVVVNGGQDRFCSATRACKRVVLPGALHGLLEETDRVRDRVLERIDAFFSAR